MYSSYIHTKHQQKGVGCAGTILWSLCLDPGLLVLGFLDLFMAMYECSSGGHPLRNVHIVNGAPGSSWRAAGASERTLYLRRPNTVLFCSCLFIGRLWTESRRHTTTLVNDRSRISSSRGNPETETETVLSCFVVVLGPRDMFVATHPIGSSRVHVFR